MKKKKRLITTIGLLLIAIVGATFAYYTSNTSFENVFNAGKYKVTLTEVFESPDNWVPGETIPKTVTAKNEGTVPAAVRISYTEQWLKEIDGVETDITTQVSPNPAIINFANQNDWTSSNGYYYYKYILEPTDETSSFISGVTLDPNLDSVTCTGEGNTKTCEAQNKASGAKYKLTFTIQTVQADQYESVWNTNVQITEKPDAITYLTRQVEGQITPGDVIGIGETEDFYVISTNAEETVLLAKYNLLVGDMDINDNDGYFENSIPIPTNTPGYGLQSVEAVGNYEIWEGVPKGYVPFSTTGYWDGSVSYGNDYISTANPYVYNENSTIYQYISGENGYVNRLKAMGAPNTITGRLMTSTEVNEILVTWDDEESYTVDDQSPIIFNGQAYWLGTAYYDSTLLGIPSGSHYLTSYWPCSDAAFGIRPVIEIPTSELQ